MKRVLLVGAAALALIVLLISALRQGDGQRPQARPSLPQGSSVPLSASNSGDPGGPDAQLTPSGVSTPTAAGQPSGDGQPTLLDPVAAAQVSKLAQQFTVAYQQRSYTDSGPTAWTERVRPLTTPDFFAQIRSQALSDPTDWAQFKKDRTTITVSDAHSTPPTVIDDSVYAGVAFTQTYRQVGSSSTNPGYLTVYVTPVSQGGHSTWLVSKIAISKPDTAGN